MSTTTVSPSEQSLQGLYARLRTRLAFDIETVPWPGAERFLREVKAPSNYRDPEAIARYEAEAREKAKAEMALDPDLAWPVVIAWLIEPSDVRSRPPAPPIERVLVSPPGDVEALRAALRQWWAAWHEALYRYGFNVLAFDLPVLARASQRLGLIVPPELQELTRFRMVGVIDLLQSLTWGGVVRPRKLTEYLELFGLVPYIDVEDRWSGADVGRLVAEGQIEAVTQHARADIRRVWRLAQYLRLWPVRGVAPWEAAMGPGAGLIGGDGPQAGAAVEERAVGLAENAPRPRRSRRAPTVLRAPAVDDTHGDGLDAGPTPQELFGAVPRSGPRHP